MIWFLQYFSYIINIISYAILTYVVNDASTFTFKAFFKHLVVGLMFTLGNVLFEKHLIILLLLNIILPFCFYYIICKNELKTSILDVIIVILPILAFTIISTESAIWFITKLNILNGITILLNPLIILLTCFFINMLSLIILIVLRHDSYVISAEIISARNMTSIAMIVFITVLPQVFIMYNDCNYDSWFMLFSIIQMICIDSLVFSYTNNLVQREKVVKENKILEIDVKNLEGMVDGVRTLKHDFNNIFQAINGYLAIEKYDALNTYVKKIMDECHIINNLSIINRETFNNPAIYGIVGSKHFIALDKGIKFDIDSTVDFNNVSFPINDLARILGILLDNAIEATVKSDNPYIRLEAKFNSLKEAYTFKVLNTYANGVKIDTNRIFEKGYSSKEIKSGLGLWEVNKLIKKSKNSQIYAETNSKNEFIQNIIIENV